MNTFGRNLRLTTFGESHGPAIGGVIDGFPAGFKIDFPELLGEIAKRRPGSSLSVTQRQETDQPEFLSGINENGITLGTPIGFIIRNRDGHIKDYEELVDKYRPNHADYTYDAKYGLRDHRGGGRASARETANWVVAGALTRQWLKKQGIIVHSILSGVGKINYAPHLINRLSYNPKAYSELTVPGEYQEQFEFEIQKAMRSGDSIGGIVTGMITGIPAGLGEPTADKLHSRLAQAMMSINAAKGFEYGIGFKASKKTGSETLDIFEVNKKGSIITKSNFSGGIQGGISNGMPVFFNVAFKPTPTIMQEVATVNNVKQSCVLKMKGRHDPCVAVRAVEVVKAMAALVIADFIL